MDVNISTNSVEAERCRNLLINQLISSQYWQGSVRSQQISNSVSLFNRYIRLSNQQNNITEVLEILRNEIPDQLVFNEFVRQLEVENAAYGTTSITRLKRISILIKEKISTMYLKYERIINNMENVVFGKLPETLQNYILPSYRKPLILLLFLNLVIFIIRATVFNWNPIFRIYSRKNRSIKSKTVFNTNSSFTTHYHPTLFEIFIEVCSFLINISMSIIPLTLPIFILHFLYGQNSQR